MGFTTLNSGLTIVVPTSGTRNWAQSMLVNTWNKISAHDHSGGGNGAPISIIDHAITTVKLSKNYGYTEATTLTPAGTTQTIDFNNGNVQHLNLGSATGTVTLTLSNPAAGSWYYIFVIQGATFRNLTFPAAVKWPQAQVPILSSASSGQVDLLMLYYDGIATNYKGMWELDFS